MKKSRERFIGLGMVLAEGLIQLLSPPAHPSEWLPLQPINARLAKPGSAILLWFVLYWIKKNPSTLLHPYPTILDGTLHGS